ncbi:hypothetical protein BOX15_Mlig009416g1 [Macrostomum lignano]|uniref:Uncharacterized protein n=1 Tax=Macrostomum lignano TaxID=282301 RepID=A0A267H8D7_9PLAT|nr:hypothetical protein BOX15_Mlig009416g1 [Macrostomum lignano]
MFKRQSMGKSLANGKQQQQALPNPQDRPMSMISSGGGFSGLFRSKQFKLSQSTASLASSSSGASGIDYIVNEPSAARPQSYQQLQQYQNQYRPHQQQQQHRSVENLSDHRLFVANSSAPSSAQPRPAQSSAWQQQREAKSASLPPQPPRLQHQREASSGSIALQSGSRQLRQAATALCVHCAVGACSLRLAAERLILTWDVWPTASASEEDESGSGDGQSALNEADTEARLRRELDSVRLLSELLRARLLSVSADPTAEADSEAAECVQRLQGAVLAAAAAGNALASLPAIARWRQDQQLSEQSQHLQPQRLNFHQVRLHCDRIEAALVGLQVAVSVEIGSVSFVGNGVSGSGGGSGSGADSGGACLVLQCERLSRSLSDLAAACRPQALPAACQPADREALQLCLRSVTAGATLLLHAVRTAHNRPADADCRGRVELAISGLRPALRALLGAASEARFSGRPLALTESERARRVRVLCRLLPVLSAAGSLLACLADRPPSPVAARRWQQRAGACIDEVRRVSADCLTALESGFSVRRD